MSDKITLADELNLIQTQIQRMGNNSFIIKGWYVTIQLALIVYLFKNTEWGYKWNILIVPLIGCSMYDIFFLRLERIYREKYSWNIAEIEKNRLLKDRLELNPEKILNLEYESITNKKIEVDSFILFYFKEMIKGLSFKVYIVSILILIIIA